MKITLGFSPCPNDTFIFDALVNKLIDTKGIDFNVRLEDVQTLNELARANELDVSKISYGVLPLLYKNYVVLNSGSALGKGVGPLLIAKEMTDVKVEDCVIAIPGANTTAHLLFKTAYPQANNKVFLRYDEIENFVLSNDSGNRLGVIIHENRFTYQDKGLQKVADLGNYWEEKMAVPIPLGGIVGKRSLDQHVLQTIDRIIKESIEFAFKRYPELSDYIRNNAQEMSEEVMRKHIDLYVNRYSLTLGKSGRSAIKTLLSAYNDKFSELKDDEIFLSDAGINSGI